MPRRIEGHLHGLRMYSRLVPLGLPALHEYLDLLLGSVGVGVKVRDARVLQNLADIAKQCDPVFARTIVGIGVEDNADLFVSLFNQFGELHLTKSTDDTFLGFVLNVKVNRDTSNKEVFGKQFGVVLLHSINVIRGQPFIPLDSPLFWSTGALHQRRYDTFSRSRRTLVRETVLNIGPHFFIRSLGHGIFLGVFLIIDLAKTLDLFRVKPGHPCYKTDTLKSVKKQTIMEQLKPILSAYATVQRQINDINTQVNTLRDERRTIELDLTALYATSREELPDKINLATSGMTFAVKRPNQWKKGWSLSKKELKSYLDELMPSQAEAVMSEIVRRQEEKMVETDYGFELKVKARD